MTKRSPKWKKDEQWMHDKLKEFCKEQWKDMKYPAEPMERFDAYSDTRLAEYKHRGSAPHYDSQMLEQGKCKALLEAAVNSDRFALYVSYNGGIFYIFNLTRLFNSNYEWNWEIKSCPTTSHFGRREYIDKKVCMLSNEDAAFAFEAETGKQVKNVKRIYKGAGEMTDEQLDEIHSVLNGE